MVILTLCLRAAVAFQSTTQAETKNWNISSLRSRISKVYASDKIYKELDYMYTGKDYSSFRVYIGNSPLMSGDSPPVQNTNEEIDEGDVGLENLHEKIKLNSSSGTRRGKKGGESKAEISWISVDEKIGYSKNQNGVIFSTKKLDHIIMGDKFGFSNNEVVGLRYESNSTQGKDGKPIKTWKTHIIIYKQKWGLKQHNDYNQFIIEDKCEKFRYLDDCKALAMLCYKPHEAIVTSKGDKTYPKTINFKIVDLNVGNTGTVVKLEILDQSHLIGTEVDEEIKYNKLLTVEGMEILANTKWFHGKQQKFYQITIYIFDIVHDKEWFNLIVYSNEKKSENPNQNIFWLNFSRLQMDVTWNIYEALKLEKTNKIVKWAVNMRDLTFIVRYEVPKDQKI